MTLMKLIIFIFNILILIKNISYAFYEKKFNNNKFGSISVIFLSFICFIITNITLLLI